MSRASMEVHELHSITVRIPDSLYKESKRLAVKRHASLNSLVSRGLTILINEDLDQEMFDAATLLGSDAESDVDFAFQAQSEVVLEQ